MTVIEITIIKSFIVLNLECRELRALLRIILLNCLFLFKVLDLTGTLSNS
jgi:hypothetical protein